MRAVDKYETRAVVAAVKQPVPEDRQLDLHKAVLDESDERDDKTAFHRAPDHPVVLPAGTGNVSTSLGTLVFGDLIGQVTHVAGSELTKAVLPVLIADKRFEKRYKLGGVKLVV